MGKWQKEVPAKSGQYWTATRGGLSAGLKVVAYDAGTGQLVYVQSDWGGWWWSEPVVEPEPPRASDWEAA